MNIPEVKTSYEYVTEFRERLEDSLKLAQEQLRKSENVTRNMTRKRNPDVWKKRASTDIAPNRQ